MFGRLAGAALAACASFVPVVSALAGQVVSAPSLRGPSAESATTLPRLLGILVAGETRHALISEADGRPPTVVEEGDQVGEWRVGRIGAHDVALDGPAGRSILQPTSGPAARPAIAFTGAVLPFIDPYRREAEFENDQ